MTFLALLFAHLLADYPLQGDFLANMKGKNIQLLAAHCGIWTGCIAVAAYLCGIHITVEMIVVQFLIHVAADFAKARKLGFYAKLDPLGAALAIDQSIHVLQIISILAWSAL